MARALSWYRDTDTGQYIFDVTVLINMPVDECFADWRNFESFPRLMTHITTVTRLGENIWHWKAVTGGLHAEWDAICDEYRQNEVISWRTISGVKNSGSVYFTPEGRGCRLAVHLAYDPPYGFIGDIVAQRRINDLFARDLQQDLENFKRAVESGFAEDYRRAA